VKRAVRFGTAWQPDRSMAMHCMGVPLGHLMILMTIVPRGPPPPVMAMTTMLSLMERRNQHGESHRQRCSAVCPSMSTPSCHSSPRRTPIHWVVRWFGSHTHTPTHPRLSVSCVVLLLLDLTAARTPWGAFCSVVCGHWSYVCMGYIGYHSTPVGNVQGFDELGHPLGGFFWGFSLSCMD
jgi:hypothetical protein